MNQMTKISMAKALAALSDLKYYAGKEEGNRDEAQSIIDTTNQVMTQLDEIESKAGRKEAFQELEELLIDVKASLYGKTGHKLPEGSKLHQLKQMITDCINEAWTAKND